jgi:hypothetical protein
VRKHTRVRAAAPRGGKTGRCLGGAPRRAARAAARRAPAPAPRCCPRRGRLARSARAQRHGAGERGVTWHEQRGANSGLVQG